MFVVVAFAQSAGSSVWDGVFTDEQVKRGAVSYQRVFELSRSGARRGDMTPALVGGGFTSNWNDLTVGDLFDRIRLTMPLDSPGIVAAANADVIAFILKTNA